VPRLAGVTTQPSPSAEPAADPRFSPGVQTLERDDTLRLEEGDHEKFSHYVAKDKLTAAFIEGTPVVALCGKVWVPTRDPQKFPVCPECKDIWENLDAGSEGGSDD
jgi:Protein of unknown function (DUF3039)